MIRRDTANQRSQLSSLVSLANFWSENDEWDTVARQNVPIVSMKIQENSLKNTIERLMRSAHELRTKISLLSTIILFDSIWLFKKLARCFQFSPVSRSWWLLVSIFLKKDINDSIGGHRQLSFVILNGICPLRSESLPLSWHNISLPKI